MTSPSPSRPSRRAALGVGASALSLGILATGIASASPAAAAPTGALAVYNVVDYGASVTAPDNSTAFNRAISAAAADGGGIVYVPTGVWKLAQTVNLTHRITLMGNGQATELVGTNANVDILSSKGVSEAGVAGVRGLTLCDFIIWASVPMAVGTAAISLDTPWAPLISNVHVGTREGTRDARDTPNNLWFGISFKNFYNALISRCLIRAHDIGLRIDGNANSADIWLEGGSDVYDARIGVLAHGGGGIYLEDADIYGCDTAVYVQAGGGGPVGQLFLGHCYLDTSTSSGLVFEDNSCLLAQLRETWISGSLGTGGGAYTGYGIWTGARQNTEFSVILTGCRIYQCAASGIFATAGRWTISGCSISGNGSAKNVGKASGIYARNLNRTAITGNTITDNGVGGTGYGIDIDQCASTIVSGNVLSVNLYGNSLKAVTLGTNA